MYRCEDSVAVRRGGRPFAQVLLYLSPAPPNGVGFYEFRSINISLLTE